MNPQRHAPIIAVALLLALGSNAAGASSQQRTALTPAGAFDLHLSREDLDVDYDDDLGGSDLEITRVGIAFHEHINPSIAGAVAIGATGIRQRDRAATADVDPTGWYFGLDFQGLWPREGTLRLGAGVGWRYTRADRSDDDGNETILDWHEAEAQTALVADVQDAVDVRVGAAHQWVRGDERLRGEESTTTRFDLDRPFSGFVQLDFLTGRAGVIRFQARGGNPQGARITFEYTY